MSNRLPGWLTNTSYTLSSRPPLKVDNLEGDGTVFNTAKRRPGQRFKAVKQAVKRLAKAEEWIDFLELKKNTEIP